MARIYPNPISPEVDSDAERKMYELLRDNLSNDYTVMHGCKWIAKNKDGSTREGESDFIIAHPDYGVLCVEVKGGGIRVDTTSGQEKWYSKDRHGTEYPLKRSPTKQAQDSQYALRDKLSSDNRTKNLWSASSSNVRWAVCFPDVATKTGYSFGPDTPSDLIIDSIKTLDVENAIEKIFQYWHGKIGLSSANQPKITGIKALTELLAPSWELKALKSIAFGDTIRKLDKLTEDQYIVLQNIRGSKRSIVTGGAGTGKTLLAMEQARRIADEGFNTLYLCFNRNLVDWVKSQIGRVPNLNIMTFNELTKYFADAAKLDWNPPNDMSKLFDDYLPNLLSKTMGITDVRFEAIIVDEAQDFRYLWWINIEEVLDSKSGRLHIFYDDNQAIYTSAQELPLKIDQQLSLYTNCRNTKNIHAAFSVYTTTASICHAELGPSVEKITIKTSSVPIDLLKDLLVTLVYKEQIRSKDIVILTPKAKGLSLWIDGVELGNLMLSWDIKLATTKDNIIGVSTIHSYKGLENTVVILTEMDEANRQIQMELAYIGLSRARVQVIVLGELPTGLS